MRAYMSAARDVALGSARTVEPVITTLAIENYRSLRGLMVRWGH